MKKIKSLLSRCKTLSRQLGRTSSYSSLRSKSSREVEFFWSDGETAGTREGGGWETIFVGSSRRRYVISSEQLSHPLVSSLVERPNRVDDRDGVLVVRCEVVLFDHLLWMLENAHPDLASDSLEELAQLYHAS